MRYRTMIGCVLILVFLGLWVGAAGWVGSLIPPDNKLAQLIYYVVAGIGWGVPVLPLMSWMGRDK
ncbi:MAG: hypothetical protein JWP35_2361 [Caulobacter sp.]|jgi:hypothetical protein|nr:hypothetical protein [Caulobacter sp.]